MVKKVLPAVPSFEASTNGSTAAAPVQAAHSLHELFVGKDTDAILDWAKQNRGSKKQEALRQEFKLIRAKPNTLSCAWLKLLADVLEQLKDKATKREEWRSEVRSQLQWLCADCEDSKQLSKASRVLVRLTEEFDWISADNVKAWAAETGSDRLQDKLLQRLQQPEEVPKERLVSPAAYSDTSPAYSPTSYSPNHSPSLHSPMPMNDYPPVQYSPPGPSSVAATAAAAAAAAYDDDTFSEFGDVIMDDDVVADVDVDDDDLIEASPEADGMDIELDTTTTASDRQLTKLDACALIRHIGQACGYGHAAMAVSFSWFHTIHVSTAVAQYCRHFAGIAIDCVSYTMCTFTMCTAALNSYC
jgi:hypothetical protein